MGHELSKGHSQSVIGSLECELSNIKRFTIGMGFSREQRHHPCPIDIVVSVKFQEMTIRGIAQFAVFLWTRFALKSIDVIEETKRTKLKRKHTK